MKNLLLLLPLLSLCSLAPLPNDVKPTHYKIRVGRPLLTDGPRGDAYDSFLVQRKIPQNNVGEPAGVFRAFTGHNSTKRHDAPAPWSIGLFAHTVLTPGAPGSISECGKWLTGLYLKGEVLYGIVHEERDCDYAKGKTNMTMRLYTSTNYGRTWTPKGPMIYPTSNDLDKPQDYKTIGEGNCTLIDGRDSYLYTYCNRFRGNGQVYTTVARAPTSAFVSVASQVAAMPNPVWKKYNSPSGFTTNGVIQDTPGNWTGGESTNLNYGDVSIGSSAGYFKPQNLVFAVQSSKWAVKDPSNKTFSKFLPGFSLAISKDKVNFAVVPDPLILMDDVNWCRGTNCLGSNVAEAGEKTDLYSYPSFISYADGSNNLDKKFMLSYTYMNAEDNFTQRYHVVQDVDVTVTTTAQDAVVGVELSNWIYPNQVERATTAPLVNNFRPTGPEYDKAIGYLLTRPIPGIADMKIEECVDDWPGHDEWIITNDNPLMKKTFTYNTVPYQVNDDSLCSEGTQFYKRVRVLGYLYNQQNGRSDLSPLYRCWNPSKYYHFVSTNINCDGKGEMNWRLGYILNQ